jgi:acetoin utilization protein AcuB
MRILLNNADGAAHCAKDYRQPIQTRLNMDPNEQVKPDQIAGENKSPMKLESIMQRNVVRADTDTTLGEAMTICFQHRIRHLPVVNNREKLAGLVTDRDLRFYISHRLGTIMENNSDRETLHHHVHVMMVRRVITANPETSVTQAAQLMVDHRVGCLPIVDAENRILGIVTTGDFLKLIADGKLAPAALPQE